MTGRRIRLYAAAIPAALFLAVFLTVLFIPNAALRDMVKRGMETQGYTFDAQRFGKALPLGITAKNLVIGIEQGPVFKADEATVKVRLLPLLAGRLQLRLDATVGGGTISLDVGSASNGMVTGSARNIRLEDIPFFPTFAGSTARGILRGDVSLTGLRKAPAGTVQVEVRGAELAGMKVAGTPLPDATYSTVQGKLAVKGGKAALESFTLQGDGLYVRLKGDLPVTSPLSAAPLNVTLELMPKPEFLEKQKFVFLLLAKYLDTPGHYQIPVRGTLGSPSLL